MNRWLFTGALCLIASLSVAEEKKPTKRGAAKKELQTIMLQQSRTYRLDVEKLDPQVYTVVAMEWTFADEIPPDLLAQIKKHPRFEKPKPLPFAGEKSKEESGYIRWLPDKEAKNKVGALVWYASGEDRKQLLISVDLMLDHKVGAGRSASRHKFEPLQLTLDLKSPGFSNVQWGTHKLPAKSQSSPSIKVTDSLQVTVTGTLTKQSREVVRCADRLLSDAIRFQFNRLPLADLTNQSHHGISLGWMGQEHLRHGLAFLRSQEDVVVRFEYNVSGPSFPLMHVGRQLQDDAWPLVLHGNEYVGSSEDDLHVFRPVEYVLSKQPVETKEK